MDKKLIREKFHKENYKFCKNYGSFRAILKIISKVKTNKKLNLLIYIAKDKEINLYKYKRFLCKKFNVYIPKMLSDNSLAFNKLRFPLSEVRFKIKESSSKIENIKIDIAIIPVLGIDKDFRRVGFGKGFYDRTFSKIDYDLLIIFIQNIKSVTKNKICLKSDIQGDFYIANGKTIKRKRSYDIS